MRSAMSQKEKVAGELLCFAARDGNVKELRRLVEGGADSDATNSFVSVVYVLACAVVKPGMTNPVTP
jgi:hypothetical protein